jgi:hypothetical protein
MRTLATPHRAVEIEVPWLREGSCEHKLWDSKGMLTSEAMEVVLETYLCVFGIEPRAVACVEADIEDLLEFFSVSEHF